MVPVRGDGELMVTSVSHIVEVDPNHGNDSPGARPRQPFRTLTAALANLQGSGLVKLAVGTYSSSSGESFPITVRDGVILQGPEPGQGQAALISGGGVASQFNGLVALVLRGSAQLRGVTVHNSRGSGIYVPEGHGMIRACYISRCSQDGVVVTGSAVLQLVKTHIEDNGGSGIYFNGQSKGVVDDCTLLRCQTGIKIDHAAAPLVQNTQASHHQVGIGLAGSCSPVLRKNRIFQNRSYGIWIQDMGHPDLGQPQDPAHNLIRHNGQADMRNDTTQTLAVVGNDLLPQRLQGHVTLAATAVPSPEAIPESLLLQTSAGRRTSPRAEPTPSTGAHPPAKSPPTSNDSESRFSDVRGHWAAPYIDALADRGLVKGYDNGLYRPDQSINRAQFAAMVAASFSRLPARKPATRFVDVPGHHWASNAIAQAQRQGFIGGYPDQTFRPEQPMARAQAIVAMAQGLKLAPAPANVLSVYHDRAQIPSYAIDAIAAATQQKMLINYPRAEQLRPLDAITRAEVAALIYQGLVVQGQVAAFSHSSPVRPEITQGSFPDIQSHWARDFIQGLLERHLLRGYDDGQFHPDQPMTRAQFAAMIDSAFHPTPMRSARAFRDVLPDYWAAQAIQSTYRGGFLSGFPDGSFAPQNAMLRVQSWVALVNGLNLLPNQRGNLSLLSKFVDSSSIPDYAAAAVAKGTELKMVVNAPDIQTLHPNRVATRAEISAVVYQTLVHLNQAPRVNNPFIVYP